MRFRVAHLVACRYSPVPKCSLFLMHPFLDGHCLIYCIGYYY